jgi:hypothetical protein
LTSAAHFCDRVSMDTRRVISLEVQQRLRGWVESTSLRATAKALSLNPRTLERAMRGQRLQSAVADVITAKADAFAVEVDAATESLDV